MTKAPDSIPQSLQDLTPQWAHFCLHVEQFITDDLGVDLSGKTVVTALSGGVDSTALLLVLHYLSKKNGCRIIAAHLNHQLRPEADTDAHWVATLCKTLKIDYVAESADVQLLADNNGLGIEEAGRDARYRLFESTTTQYNADFIALGHHLDDLCEDVLMRLTRGTAWPGLSGMPGYDPKRQLIRPFLLTPKTKLIEFLTDIGITWREDETNTDPKWTRNRMRNTILPLFLKENPNFRESIARLWKVGTIDQDYWAEQTSGSTDILTHEMLQNTHQALRLRLYKAALDSLDGGQALAETLFKLDKAWREKRIGSTFQFPGDKTAIITALGMVFSTKH